MFIIIIIIIVYHSNRFCTILTWRRLPRHRAARECAGD